MREIEIEIKNEWPLSDEPRLAVECVCGKRAMRTVEFGEVKNHYGCGHEIDLCLDRACLDAAMDQTIRELRDLNLYRKEYAQQERWDYREGK